ncbi:MAG: hypothetical protein QOD58_1304 [Mycobacterium sp.]|jgi:hypothetical protein|nr:hypothetical protein [Mycobacterium sp.]
MSWVIAAPEYVAAAASDLAGIGSSLSASNALAAFPTTAVLAAGADEVSATIAALFGAHAQAYQALSQQAALFHEQFVQLMTGGAGQYAAAEALNSTPMQDAAAAISAQGQALTGFPFGGAAGGASTAGGSNDERILHSGKNGTLVQLGTGPAGAAGGLGAPSTIVQSGVSGSGGGNAGVGGLPYLPLGLGGNGNNPGPAAVAPVVAIEGPIEGLGDNVAGLGGVSPVVVGQSPVGGLGSNAALLAGSPAGASASEGSAGHSGDANNGGGLSGHQGWLYGDGGLSANTGLFGDSGAGGNGGLREHAQLPAAVPLADGGGGSGFFSGGGGHGSLGTIAGDSQPGTPA